MGNYLLAAGCILNSVIIVVNRSEKKLPGWVYFPGMILGIGMIIVGGIMMK